VRVRSDVVDTMNAIQLAIKDASTYVLSSNWLISGAGGMCVVGRRERRHCFRYGMCAFDGNCGNKVVPFKNHVERHATRFMMF
jgi:hypothetical protein